MKGETMMQTDDLMSLAKLWLTSHPLLAAVTAPPRITTLKHSRDLEVRLSTLSCPQLKETRHGSVRLPAEVDYGEASDHLRIFVDAFERTVAENWSVTNG